MTKLFGRRIKYILSCTAPLRTESLELSVRLDVREEYANAFRTESYDEFWKRVLALSKQDSSTCKRVESTTAARLSSYRLFAEQLLDPDRATVHRVLALARNKPTTHTLLSQYFTETTDASLLCSALLKDVDNVRVKYRFFEAALRSLEASPLLHEKASLVALTQLTEFSNSPNPFNWSSPSQGRVSVMQAETAELLKKLESSRDNIESKLKLSNKLRQGSAVFLVALTASLTIIVVTHALVLVVAAPSIISATMELASSKRLAKVSAQLDAAAKGTYILSRDLETIRQLVSRLNDELDHIITMTKFWLEHREDWLEADAEVVRQLKRNDCNFEQQLDELAEHLYLCFMTINRARNLVVKEIIDSGPYNNIS